MIKITNEERNYLVNEKNVPCGGEGIIATIAKRKKRTYYMCEKSENMIMLNEYRERKVK